MESIQPRDLDEAIIFSAEYYDHQLIAKEEIECQVEDPIAFASINDPDNLYYHQAIRDSNQDSFIQAIVKELN
eukprot:10638784-Ditylum_brightwellii.AAC.2